MKSSASVDKIVENYKNGQSNRTSTNVMRNMQMTFIDTWSNALADSPKLAFYKQLKTSMDCEEYLKIKDFSLRRSISQLRASAHCLLIERLRYTTPKTPREDRLCTYCKLAKGISVIDSELHAICECPLYSIHHKKFTQKTNISTQDSIISPNTNNSIIQYHFGILCKNIFETHEAFQDYINNYYGNYPLNRPMDCIIL